MSEYSIDGGIRTILRLFIYLTPCVPLSFEGEGEDNRRGANTPLKRPVRLIPSKVRGKVYFERVEASLRSPLPSPFMKGEG
jgi:hypothetical protein